MKPSLPPAQSSHAFSNWSARTREGLTVCHRRGMLKASMAGLAGLTLPELLRRRASAAEPAHGGKSLILLWMAGGPSHLDMWDPKPGRPVENRGPFDTISTKLPGVAICEHLPLQAAMMDQCTLIRSVDCRHSNHQPNVVMQTGHLEAAPRTNPQARLIPSIGSIVAKFHGANHPSMPPYAAFMKHDSHLGFAGMLGKRYDPFIADKAVDLPVYTDVGVDTGRTTGPGVLAGPADLGPLRLAQRQSLRRQFDRLRHDLDLNGSMEALDHYERQAIELVTGGRAQQAFNLKNESPAVRERYGKHLWSQQALLGRRLVQAGCPFVTLDLSHHRASGTWDTHGDFTVYGGIEKGLRPLLPVFDHMFTTLVSDLEQQGMLDDTLVIAMGEFGRTPQIGTQNSSDGRNHWPVVMSMLMAGGGLRHGQLIGASDSDGGQIAERPVTPGDLAATIYRYFNIPLDATYLDSRGRPHYIVQNGGQPIAELF
ncbi:DUF1501 domain-containing protein [Lignipirellula cremea]|uniref:DUF1501 domain-containing protein n=1 Tax=Lignipirellula cremea TaxID=2528010 RepID=A0A518DW50_9BACT|nr:DUF1501 domain-containing protein [Lignipirellula cremea]QDU96053.1 hypothetical protein Pla8534_38720 [Lignipirellula cremea]